MNSANEVFETQHVPYIFENICKQYLIRLNKVGKIDEPFFKIGKYYYDDPIHKTNGKFDIVTLDDLGYIFYEAKFKNTKMDISTIQTEIQQVNSKGLKCYRYGFFSKSGFEDIQLSNVILYTLDDLFTEQKLTWVSIFLSKNIQSGC